MSALLLLTHTLTHNRKSASGFSGLFSKPNRHFLSHAAPIGLEITLLFLQGDFGTKRPCVQVTSLRPVKMPGNRVFMRLPGSFVFLWFPVLFGRDPYCDPYGIWRTLCVLLGKPLAGRNTWARILWQAAKPRFSRHRLLRPELSLSFFLYPTFVQKCPTLAFWRLGLVVFPSAVFCGRFRADVGLFLSEKK